MYCSRQGIKAPALCASPGLAKDDLVPGIRMVRRYGCWRGSCVHPRRNLGWKWLCRTKDDSLHKRLHALALGHDSQGCCQSLGRPEQALPTRYRGERTITEKRGRESLVIQQAPQFPHAVVFDAVGAGREIEQILV